MQEKPEGHEQSMNEEGNLLRNGERPPFECIALVLQGGGALGAYQGGVYQALDEANLHPDWVAGISIGAINSAIIAGNKPEHRVEKLRDFWEARCKGRAPARPRRGRSPPEGNPFLQPNPPFHGPVQKVSTVEARGLEAAQRPFA